MFGNGKVFQKCVQLVKDAAHYAKALQQPCCKVLLKSPPQRPLKRSSTSPLAVAQSMISYF